MSYETAKIKLIILDVDGTLTDGGIYILESGEQFKKFNAKDGLGIKRTIASGCAVAIISHSLSHAMIRKRADMMGITKCYTGDAAKLDVLNEWCSELEVPLEAVAFIGDDLNDLDIIRAVGFSACPADAMPAVREACDVVLQTEGGRGCVREFIDRFILSPDIDVGVALHYGGQ